LAGLCVWKGDLGDLPGDDGDDSGRLRDAGGAALPVTLRFFFVFVCLRDVGVSGVGRATVASPWLARSRWSFLFDSSRLRVGAPSAAAIVPPDASDELLTGRSGGRN
jgi:hypothetical protein